MPKALRQVIRHAAHSHPVVGQPRAGTLLQQVQHHLALAEGVEEHGRSAQVGAERAQKHQMAGDTLEFHEQHADILGAFGNLYPSQPFDALADAQVIGQRGEVVQSVGEGDVVAIGATLHHLLQPAMQVTDDRLARHNLLAVQCQYQP